MPRKRFTDSDLLNYILDHRLQPGDSLPPLTELQKDLGVNVGKLREQLEVGRALGLVEVRPRTGIRCKPYDFFPAVRLSLLYALSMSENAFAAFTELRNHLEIAFMEEACEQLSAADFAALRSLISIARAKLTNSPSIQIPHEEHRAFHMGLFRYLANPFVISLLEGYWEAYEAVELNTYADLHYWQEAWDYHERILDHLERQEFEAARGAFLEHTDLMRHRQQSAALPLAALLPHPAHHTKE
ncbi:MAG TPA: FCD domain-containing protein [Aggregatilineales bacterium]|nr:FadR family transcriptional regulator [Anaerolineales bacterium]HRE46347.1 FCD domain-containing protein [Aggregatilineales bacterium]